MSTAQEDARALRALRDKKDALYAQHKAAEEAYSKAHGALLERFEDEEIDGLKTGGTNYVPTSTTYGTIQDRDEFVRWASEEAPELLQVKERPALLNELVRECHDDGRALPPGVGSYPKAYISQRVD